MSKNRIFISALCFLIVSVIAFKPKATDTFKVDLNASSIKWVANKVTGSHNGTIKPSAGTLILDGKTLKGGEFTIDMTSITITDLTGNSNQNLLKHLKNDDFFSVDKFPTSTFKITSVAKAGTDRVNITGNLTIKGVSAPITFPASVKADKNVVVAVAKGVKVDRTKYDIKYRSKNFFGDIGDKAIEDEFTLDINLVAKK